MTFLILSVAAAMALQSQAPAPDEQASPGEEDILVTGERIEGASEAEEPYSTTERVPLGSRIERKTGPRLFRTVATESGLGGLISGPGNDFNATGAAAPRMREILVKECKSNNGEVTEETACRLIKVSDAMEAGDHDAARAELQALREIRTLPDPDRYYVAVYAYRVAQQFGDAPGREAALEAMLATGAMPPEQRPSARRSLVALALDRGDDPAAIGHLESLLALHPEDSRSQANLAALYARAGSHDKALPHMLKAVALVEQAGGAVPKSWADYVAAQRP